MSEDSVYEQGYDQYKYLLPGLYRYSGDYIVIEPDSNDYYIDASLNKALQKARKEHTEKKFFIAKIGEREGSIARWRSQ